MNISPRGPNVTSLSCMRSLLYHNGKSNVVLLIKIYEMILI